MILIGQHRQTIIPFPCAIDFGRYDASKYAIYLTSNGERFSVASYSGIVPARMEIARLISILEQPEEQWPATFTFSKEVSDE